MSPMALPPFARTQPSLLSSRLHFPNPIARVVSSSTGLPSPRPPSSPGKREKQGDRIEMGVSSSTSALRRALGQRFNREGVASFLGVAVTEPHLTLPHLFVPDIGWVDWPALRRLGFRGVVFDKDNTLTAPYSLALWPPLSPSLRLCQTAFPGSIAVFSNSVGLKQYDPDGAEAKALEGAIEGIRVIKHEVKKPSGTAEDIERYFGCPASLLVMVGDRVFTDVVYGNKHGFLTILTDPFSLSGEPFIVKQVRKLERLLVNYWRKKDVAPLFHEQSLSIATRMGKTYVVSVGREPDIYDTWIEAASNVNGFKGAIHQSFKSRKETEGVYQAHLDKTFLSTSFTSSGSQYLSAPSSSSSSSNLKMKYSSSEKIAKLKDALEEIKQQLDSLTFNDDD